MADRSRLEGGGGEPRLASAKPAIHRRLPASAACVDCGERDPVVLDFDHVGAKRDLVVQLAYREHSIASIEREIAECQIRCANCHRRSTIEKQGQFRHHLLEPL
jgi:hypothetical protein